MCVYTSSRKSTRESDPTFPSFWGMILTFSQPLSTGMVEVRVWAFQGSLLRGFWEIYCNDKETRSGVFRTTNRSENWKVYMEPYMYIEKHSSQRSLLQVVVVWIKLHSFWSWRLPPALEDIPKSNWSSHQFLSCYCCWTKSCNGGNSGWTSINCSPLITRRDALTVPSALSIPSIHGVVILREMY